jgi:hypothetical protein
MFPPNQKQVILLDLQQKTLKYILVGFLSIFFLLYAGLEISYGLYIATFSVESQLNLSKSEGAYITAIYWGCFATMRCLAIFAAIKFRPIYVMVMSFTFCLMGSVPLTIWGETSVLVLKVKLYYKILNFIIYKTILCFYLSLIKIFETFIFLH